MPLSKEGQQLKVIFKAKADQVEKLERDLHAKLDDRIKKATSRMAWAKASKDDGHHFFKGLRDKFIKVLTPANQNTLKALAALKTACGEAQTSVKGAVNSIANLESVLENSKGSFEIEKKYFEPCIKNTISALEKLTVREDAYQDAKVKEKTIYTEMKSYMDQKGDKKDEGKPVYKAFKKEFEDRLKELGK